MQLFIVVAVKGIPGLDCTWLRKLNSAIVCFDVYSDVEHAPIRLFKHLCRLWVVPKEADEPTDVPQQLGYVNVVPCRNELGLFERFGDTVRRFNQHLRQRPLPGTGVLHIDN